MDNKKSIVSGPDSQPYTAAFTQPITSPGAQDTTQPMQPAQMAQPLQASNAEQNPLTGAPMIMQAPAPVAEPKKDAKSLIKTIAIIALSLISVTFIGLFIWMYVQYDEKRTDVDGQIAKAVVEAVDENTVKLENDFAEREKYPFKTFAGPADYGELTFKYPKTWSVYVAKDAHNGGDFEAYLNPSEVYEVGNETLMALRVKILNRPFDDVVSEYQSDLEGETPRLRLESVTLGENNDITANRYSGILPNTEFDGFVVIFKIRDKTAIIQTDSKTFENDYNKLLSSIVFNA